MCGILGQISTSNPIDHEVFDTALEKLVSRGPDGGGRQLLENDRVGLGHRRLSIIDLTDDAAQPMPNEDESVWLTFNGEIYNYRELRRELEVAGHRFRSRSDSEVLVHGYEQWGIGMLPKLNGIFSFGVFDVRRQHLLLVRDHIGVKPLYYATTERGIGFASQPGALIEVLGMKPRIEESALSLFLGFGYVPGEHCLFQGVSKLLPGHYLLWEDGKTEVKQYWTLPTEPVIFDEVEAIEAVGAALAESIQGQLVGDVPVGVYVSGGIDSSIVSTLAVQAANKPLTAFTIGFDEEEADERPYARQLTKSLGIRHIEEVLRSSDLWELLPSIVEAYDEPFFGGSAFPTYLISHLARKNGCKVILSGDGGDELYAGYKRYDWFTEAMSKGARRRFWKRRSQRPNAQQPEDIYFNLPTMAILKDRDRLRLLGRQEDSPNLKPSSLLRKYYLEELTPAKAAQYMDMHVYLPDHILCKVDRASMANGVEVRVPFLDPKLVELSFRIDDRILYRGGERKALLKKTVSRHVPRALLTGRKKGFSIPLGSWMEKEFTSWGRDLVLDGSMIQRGLLNSCAATEIYDKGESRFKWLLISLELWARRWVEGEKLENTIFNNYAE